MPKPNDLVSGVKYIGDGAFIEGVPARDMTPEEWQALEAEKRETALKLRLYRIVKIGRAHV